MKAPTLIGVRGGVVLTGSFAQAPVGAISRHSIDAANNIGLGQNPYSLGFPKSMRVG